MYSKKVHFASRYPDYSELSLIQIPRLKFIQTKIKNDKNDIFQRKIGFEKSNQPVKETFNQKIKRAGKEFFILFLNSSSIHGLNHLTRVTRHPVEIIIWIFIVGIALFGAVYLSMNTWERYQYNPVVISMERDRFGWNTSFPAATICPTSKINEKKLRAEISKFNFTDNEKAMNFITALAKATYKNFRHLPEFDEIDSRNYTKILLEYAFIFEPSVSNSGASGNQYHLEKTITEVGICYSFNSKLAKYSSPDYWASGSWKFLKGNETFFVHPLDGEVFANVVNMSTGFDMYTHGPEETIDSSSRAEHSANGYFLQVYLTALTLFSSDAARDLKISQRKCRFPHESNLRHSPAYSYTLCRIECRLRQCLKLCGCIPHFYRRRDNEKVCNVKGLHCLGNHTKLLITLEDENTSLCSCLPNCDSVRYVVEVLDTREWFLGSNLQWGLKDYPPMRLKRDIIFGFEDLLVYVGGMAGLFLGCSVLSFAEIIYFLTIRLFWFVIDYRKETQRILNK